jgi:membrane-bound metal-dependent hydrolase YbcI (DUF457 family)
LVASVIVDVEPILVLLLNLDYPLHGFFHSFVGGTLVALLLSVVMSKIRDSLSPLMSFFKLEEKSSFRNILLASLSGLYMHILLDSRIHMDIQPFYPLDFNPFLSGSTSAVVGIYMLCLWCFVGAAVFYVIKRFLFGRKVVK